MTDEERLAIVDRIYFLVRQEATKQERDRIKKLVEDKKKPMIKSLTKYSKIMLMNPQLYTWNKAIDEILKSI